MFFIIYRYVISISIHTLKLVHKSRCYLELPVAVAVYLGRILRPSIVSLTIKCRGIMHHEEVLNQHLIIIIAINTITITIIIAITIQEIKYFDILSSTTADLLISRVRPLCLGPGRPHKTHSTARDVRSAFRKRGRKLEVEVLLSAPETSISESGAR